MFFEIFSVFQTPCFYCLNSLAIEFEIWYFSAGRKNPRGVVIDAGHCDVDICTFCSGTLLFWLLEYRYYHCAATVNHSRMSSYGHCTQKEQTSPLLAFPCCKCKFECCVTDVTNSFESLHIDKKTHKIWFFTKNEILWVADREFVAKVAMTLVWLFGIPPFLSVWSAECQKAVLR